MSGILSLRNRQRTRAVDLRLLRRITIAVLHENLWARDAGEAERYEIGIQLIPAAEMAELNQKYLHHHGSTDVITFDYSEPKPAPSGRCRLQGDIFICLDEAVAQARRFRTSWHSELVRYLIHGILHLSGHGDLDAGARRAMKHEENRLLRKMTHGFALSRLGRRPTLGA